ncbi:hypothetical protein ABZ743_24195 [Streptomyces sp. NPDC006662]|uniref:hypothetical protein n=1 Tax=Streptomyces sp. NPDC006662 TaxID=3156902 RepID=UPI0033CFD75C
MKLGGKSSVWLCVGQTRVRADRLVAVERAPGSLALHCTGMRQPLHLALPAPASGPGSGQASSHADQLLAAIAYAAEYPSATLITYQDSDEYFVGSFTARTLAGQETVVARRLLKPAPTLAELTARRPGSPLNGPS